jgi:hypothetical protein
MQLFPNPTKTYATRENAVKKLKATMDEIGADPSHIIATTEEGRYFAIVKISGTLYKHLMAYFAQKGICVI